VLSFQVIESPGSYFSQYDSYLGRTGWSEAIFFSLYAAVLVKCRVVCAWVFDCIEIDDLE